MTCAIVDRQRRLPLARRSLARVAERALAALGRSGGDVELLVVDDAEIRRLNRRFRGVHRATDVLAFPLEVRQAGSGLVGQIVISAETAVNQARRLGVPVSAEMELLVTHGILHLVGYDDRDPVEASLMHERERQILTRHRRRLPARLWTGLLRS
jgi:probable rRNA maturation factor